jgi:hypothetical protein
MGDGGHDRTTPDAKRPRWLRWLIDLAARPVGPHALAIGLAVASLPIVLLEIETFDLADQFRRDAPRLPPLDPAAVVAATGAVLSAAVLASTVGTRLVRSAPPIAAIIMVGIAWGVGVVTLPVWPALFGLPYGAIRLCIDGCSLQITGPTSGFRALAFVWMSPFWALWTFITLIVGVAFWTCIVARSKPPSGSVKSDEPAP